MSSVSSRNYCRHGGLVTCVRHHTRLSKVSDRFPPTTATRQHHVVQPFASIQAQVVYISYICLGSSKICRLFHTLNSPGCVHRRRNLVCDRGFLRMLSSWFVSRIPVPGSRAKAQMSVTAYLKYTAPSSQRFAFARTRYVHLQSFALHPYHSRW